jgi:hypothetical protein
MLTVEGVVSRLDMYARWRSRWDGVVPFKPRFRSWAGCGGGGDAQRQGRRISAGNSRGEFVVG